MKTFYELGYMDIDEAIQLAGEMNKHHFHYYDSGMVTYKKKYMHLYKRKSGIRGGDDSSACTAE